MCPNVILQVWGRLFAADSHLVKPLLYLAPPSKVHLQQSLQWYSSKCTCVQLEWLMCKLTWYWFANNNDHKLVLECRPSEIPCCKVPLRAWDLRVLHQKLLDCLQWSPYILVSLSKSIESLTFIRKEVTGKFFSWVCICMLLWPWNKAKATVKWRGKGKKVLNISTRLPSSKAWHHVQCCFLHAYDVLNGERTCQVSVAPLLRSLLFLWITVMGNFFLFFFLNSIRLHFYASHSFVQKHGVWDGQIGTCFLFLSWNKSKLLQTSGICVEAICLKSRFMGQRSGLRTQNLAALHCAVCEKIFFFFNRFLSRMDFLFVSVFFGFV